MKKILSLVLICLAVFAFVSCKEEGMTQNTEVSEQPENVIKSITVTCAGDCTLGTDAAFGGVTFPVEAENQGNDYSYFLKNVKSFFENDDLTIVNFEGTLTDRGQRQDKTFAFKGKPEYTKVLTSSSVEAVTLANNHSRDYGTESLEDTRKYLEESGVIWFENQNTRVIDINGVKVGLIGLYDLDFSANDVLPKAMENVKNQGAELILVQIHWGIEGENYPNDTQIALAHRCIDSGADLVIGHHPHVLQGIECYNGKMIAYSMGNFCFGGNQNPRDKDSMIFRQTFTIDKNGVANDNEYCVIPCSISSLSSRNNYQPTLLKGDEYERVKNKIQKFSDNLGQIKVKFDEENSESTKTGK